MYNGGIYLGVQRWYIPGCAVGWGIPWVCGRGRYTLGVQRWCISWVYNGGVYPGYSRVGISLVIPGLVYPWLFLLYPGYSRFILVIPALFPLSFFPSSRSSRHPALPVIPLITRNVRNVQDFRAQSLPDGVCCREYLRLSDRCVFSPLHPAQH